MAASGLSTEPDGVGVGRLTFAAPDAPAGAAPLLVALNPKLSGADRRAAGGAGNPRANAEDERRPEPPGPGSLAHHGSSAGRRSAGQHFFRQGPAAHERRPETDHGIDRGIESRIERPVEVLVNHCLIARGEVVVVEGNYGIRIQEIASRQDRLRSLR
jgi:hypothetical protein